MVKRSDLQGVALTAIGLWIAIWTFIFWMNLHRVDVGDLGAWSWSRLADTPLLPAARRAFYLANASYENDVGRRAWPWVRAAGVALAASGVVSLMIAAWPRPSSRPLERALESRREFSLAPPSNDEDSPPRRVRTRRAS